MRFICILRDIILHILQLMFQSFSIEVRGKKYFRSFLTLTFNGNKLYMSKQCDVHRTRYILSFGASKRKEKAW